MGRVTVAQRMTAREYLALPEQHWTSLVEGELVVAQPRIEHQAVAGSTCSRSGRSRRPVGL